MCIVFLAHQVHAAADLMLLANRDEFFARPAEPMHRWAGPLGITAGRDLEAGGTWLALREGGHFALVTNYRDMRYRDFKGPSRGRLVTQFFELSGDTSSFSAWLEHHGQAYAGFNMFYGRPGDLFYFSNVEGKARRLGAGTFGLSNAFLDTPWPKVSLGKVQLHELIQQQNLPRYQQCFDILGNQNQPNDDALPDTGVGLAWERFLSPVFIAGESYGSRCGTVAFWRPEAGVTCEERTYHGSPQHFSAVQFSLK